MSDFFIKKIAHHESDNLGLVLYQNNDDYALYSCPNMKNYRGCTDVKRFSDRKEALDAFIQKGLEYFPKIGVTQYKMFPDVLPQ